MTAGTFLLILHATAAEVERAKDYLDDAPGAAATLPAGPVAVAV